MNTEDMLENYEDHIDQVHDGAHDLGCPDCARLALDVAHAFAGLGGLTVGPSPICPGCGDEADYSDGFDYDGDQHWYQGECGDCGGTVTCTSVYWSRSYEPKEE